MLVKMNFSKKCKKIANLFKKEDVYTPTKTRIFTEIF